MTNDPAATESGGGAEWQLTPGELRSLRSTRRLFLLGLTTAGLLAVSMAALTLWVASRRPLAPAVLGVGALGSLALAALAAWCARRARIVGQDITNRRVEMQWGRLTRIFRGLRVAEVEGALFPLQMTVIPALRAGERVWLRFAPRSRITFGIQTLREVVAAERLAGRAPCPGILAELGEQP
ncbi:MAG: hypothetical protein HYT85_01485 [candidate division NC10 bacterium]|nr:hypothetical protein [candidate division NC10 bacterium]